MTRTARRRIALLASLLALAALAVQLNRTQLWEDAQLHAGWRLQHHVLLGSCRLLDRDQVTRARGRGDDCAAAFERIRREEALAAESRHLVLLLHGMGRSAGPRRWRLPKGRPSRVCRRMSRWRSSPAAPRTSAASIRC
jgi:hypothetical protein